MSLWNLFRCAAASGALLCFAHISTAVLFCQVSDEAADEPQQSPADVPDMLDAMLDAQARNL